MCCILYHRLKDHSLVARVRYIRAVCHVVLVAGGSRCLQQPGSPQRLHDPFHPESGMATCHAGDKKSEVARLFGLRPWSWTLPIVVNWSSYFGSVAIARAPQQQPPRFTDFCRFLWQFYGGSAPLFCPPERQLVGLAHRQRRPESPWPRHPKEWPAGLLGAGGA